MRISQTLANHGKQRALTFLTLSLLVAVALWSGISIGAAEVSFIAPLKLAIAQFSADALSFTQNIILNIRLPRVLMAFFVGAALAVSGASLQGVCRNPLADPSLLGISAGASVGAVSMIVLMQFFPSTNQIGPYLIPIAAVLGAVITAFSVYHLAQVDGTLQIPTLLLAGVAINALGIAIIGAFNYLADDQSLRMITFWLMGSLAGANWSNITIIAPVLALALWATLRQRHALNLLLLGEPNARYSGIDVDRVKNQLLWLNALIVGVAVAFSGIIGFVGLVVPHILRVQSDTNYRYLIINSALLGGALLIAADIGSRVLIAPAELPIGILTSLLGAPFFIFLLLQQKRKLGFGL